MRQLWFYLFLWCRKSISELVELALLTSFFIGTYLNFFQEIPVIQGFGTKIDFPLISDPVKLNLKAPNIYIQIQVTHNTPLFGHIFFEASLLYL